MRTYLFEAKTTTGDKVVGSLDAEDMREALELLKQQNYTPLALEKKRGMIDSWLSVFEKVNVRALAIFSRQLAIMVEAGFPLIQAIKTSVAQTSNEKLKETLAMMAIDVESGLSLSMSMAKYPDVFSRFMVNMVRSGEETGKLNQVLKEIAVEVESQQKFQSKIGGVLVYPAFVILMMVAAVIVVMIYVIPQLKGLFDDVGAQLPWTTKLLIAFSDFFVNYWYLILIGVIVIVSAIVIFLRSDYGRDWKDRNVLKLPIFGKLVVSSSMVRFARTFGMLVDGGIPILDAIEITSGVMDNIVFKRAIRDCTTTVEKGIPFSNPIRRNPLFPTVVSQMIGVGEQSGQLGKSMTNLAGYFEEELDNMIKSVFSLFEPLMLIIVGIGVAGLVFAVLLPVFQLSQVM